MSDEKFITVVQDDNMRKMMREWKEHIEKQNPDAGFVHLNIEHEDGRIQSIKAWPLDYVAGDVDETTGLIPVTATFAYEPEPQSWYRRFFSYCYVMFVRMWRALF